MKQSSTKKKPPTRQTTKGDVDKGCFMLLWIILLVLIVYHLLLFSLKMRQNLRSWILVTAQRSDCGDNKIQNLKTSDGKFDIFKKTEIRFKTLYQVKFFESLQKMRESWNGRKREERKGFYFFQLSLNFCKLFSFPIFCQLLCLPGLAETGEYWRQYKDGGKSGHLPTQPKKKVPKLQISFNFWAKRNCT